MRSPSDRAGAPPAPPPLPAFKHAALAQRLEMKRAVRFAAEAALRRGAPRTLPAPPKAKGAPPVVRR